MSWILEEDAFSAPTLFVFRGCILCFKDLKDLQGFARAFYRTSVSCGFFPPWAPFYFPDATSDDLTLYQPFVGSLESSHHSTMLNLIPAYAHFV